MLVSTTPSVTSFKFQCCRYGFLDVRCALKSYHSSLEPVDMLLIAGPSTRSVFTAVTGVCDFTPIVECRELSRRLRLFLVVVVMVLVGGVIDVGGVGSSGDGSSGSDGSDGGVSVENGGREGGVVVTVVVVIRGSVHSLPRGGEGGG